MENRNSVRNHHHMLKNRFLITSITCGALVLPAMGLEPEVTPVEHLNVKEGFKVERLYSVPKAKLGSWVVLCEDDKGRLIAGDQYGSLYRFSPPAAGKLLKDEDIEKIDLDIGHAWGMCYAFDSLYVVINDKAHGGRGLYRVQDTDGDDQFDKVSLLKKFQENGGEHGPHAVSYTHLTLPTTPYV